jgi:hypothetical protein
LNATFRVLGRSYRLFLHPPPALVAAAGAEGLSLEDEGRTLAWQYLGFRRQA